MRPIKYRAWHKDLKIMREVFSINFDHNEVTVGYPDSETLRATLYDGEFELMQFTGLSDIEGNDIYEGDVIKEHASGLIYNVEFDDGCFFYATAVVCKSSIESYEVEVIGNIHENPELLETK